MERYILANIWTTASMWLGQALLLALSLISGILTIWMVIQMEPKLEESKEEQSKQNNPHVNPKKHLLVVTFETCYLYSCQAGVSSSFKRKQIE